MKIPCTAVILLFVVVILVIGGYILFQAPISLIGEQDSATGTLSPTQPVTIGPTLDRSKSPTATPTPPVIVPATPSPVPTQTKKPVEFTLDPGTPVNCGLTCRETTATITNTGDETAHSVCVVLEVFNENGERIFINSAPSIERCLGDIDGGSSKSETITINADCGFLAGKCVGHTLILKTRATSLEESQIFPDSLMVV